MNTITMSKFNLQQMLNDAAELGANTALVRAGILKPYISKQDAFRAYGRNTVERWIKEGLVTPRKDGQASAKWRIDRVEIEAVSKASNRPSYLSVQERNEKAPVSQTEA